MALSDNSNITKADDTDQKQSNIQLSVTAEKLNDINKEAKSTVQSLNNVFNAVSGANNFARTFDDLTNGIQNAASALDALTKQVNDQDKILNNIAAVQAQFDGLQNAYANINSKLGDLVKSADNSALDNVDKIIHNIEKMEKDTSSVSKTLKKSLQKMAEDSGNTEEINTQIKTIENNFLTVSDEIKSKFNGLIQKQLQDIISGIQASADMSLASISNGRGLQKSFNRSITNTGNSAAYAYQDAVVVQQMDNRQHFWNQSSADFGNIAHTASEMGVMQTKYEHASSRVRDSYTNAEHEDDPEKRKKLIAEANEQYKNLVSIQTAMNKTAKELGKQMHLVSPEDIKRLGQEGKDLQKQVKKILSETSANSGRLISIGAAFNVKDNEEVAKGFAKDKEELDKVNNSLDDINKKTGDLAKTIKNDLASSFNTLMAPFRMLGKYLPLLGAGGMFGLMNNITKPLQYYSEKHKDMYSSMGTDAYAGVGDLGASQANANARLMRGNSLYAMSGGMIDRRAINNSYNSAMREVGGAYGSTPNQGAADMNELVNKTALMQNVWGIDQGTMNNAYQTFYKDMRMNASEAADAIARVAQTAQASGIPVGKYLNMISGLAHDFMKIGIDGDKAETVMSGLLGKGMRADVAQDIAGQSANAMGGFAQNYNMVGYAAAMQGMDPFHGLALASYSHEANGEVRHGWAGDMSKMMDTMLNQYSMAYGDNPDVKRFGVTDTLKKQFGFSQRAASTLTSSYLQGDTKQFEEMFEKEMDKKDNPNGALEDVNKQLGEQLGQMTGQLANSDKLRAVLDANLYAAADTLGKKMDNIVTKLAPILEKVQNALLKLAGNILKFIDTFLNSKLWNKLIKPAAETVLAHPFAAGGAAMAGLVGVKSIKHLRNVMKDPQGLSGALKGMGKGAAWKLGKYGATAGLAYGAWKLLTNNENKDDNKNDSSAQDNSSDSPGGIFDKIYNVIDKTYQFFAGKSLDSNSSSSGSGSGSDSGKTSSNSGLINSLMNGPGSGPGLGIAGAGTLALASGSHFGSSSSDSSSSGSGSDSVNDKLSSVADGTKAAKNSANKAASAKAKESSANKTIANTNNKGSKTTSTAIDKAKKEDDLSKKKHAATINTNKNDLIKNGKEQQNQKKKEVNKLHDKTKNTRNSLSKMINGGTKKARGLFGGLLSSANSKFRTIGKIFSPALNVLKKIAGPLAGIVGLGSDAIGHLMNGDAVEGDGVNSVVNNALPVGMTALGAGLGSVFGPAGTIAGGMLGNWAGNKLNDTDTAKWAKNGILGAFGDSDEDQDRKRREQKPWAYNDDGSYKFGDDTKEKESEQTDSDSGSGKFDNDTMEKEAEQADSDLKKATNSTDSDMQMVDSGDDSGSENKLRKSDDSRMKASKDNSDKVVGQAKKEEKSSIERNKQIQMFQNLHKQLMQMFQSSVKEEHGNLWKKLDIMEHILFDVNKNIISSGQILNKGLANIKGGGPGGGNEAENKKLFYQKLKAAGYSDAQAAGIMANISQESSFNAESGKGSAHQGLVQWDSIRWARLVAYAHSVNQSEWNPGIQMDFAISEAQGRGLTPDKIGDDAQAACASWNETEENSGEDPAKFRYGKIAGIEADIASGKYAGTAPPAADPVEAAKKAAAAVGTIGTDSIKPPATTTNPTLPNASEIMPVVWANAGSKENYDSMQQMSGGNNDISSLDASKYIVQTPSSSPNTSNNGTPGNRQNNNVLQDGINANGTITKNGKFVDRFTSATRQKIEANLAKGLAPNGKAYLQNDIDYLKAHGYTDMEEIKIALNQDKRYAMAADNPDYLNLLKSGGVSSGDLNRLYHSNISMQSPFANNVKFVNSAHGVDAYWGDDNKYFPKESILSKVTADPSSKNRAHYYGADALMAGLYTGKFGSSSGSKTRSSSGSKASADDTANIDTKADETAKAVVDAAKATAVSTTNTGAHIDNGSGKSISSGYGDSAVINSGIGAAMTKAVTDAVEAGDQDKSDVQKGTAESKKDKIIDVNINIEAAEAHFMKMFGNSLKSAIENTGLKVTSLEQHTTEIAKQVTTAEISIMDLMGAQRVRQK